MIGNILDLLVKLVEALWARRSDKKTAALEFLDSIIEDCRALVLLEDMASDEAVLIHEKLKEAYEKARESFCEVFPRDEMRVFLSCIMGARVYYRVKLMAAKTPAFEPNEKLDMSGVAWLANFAAADVGEISSHKLWGMLRQQLKEGSINLTSIRRRCLRDIAKLESLRNRLRQNV